MFDWLQPLQVIRDFLDSGGYVLWAIFGVSILLWALIFERYWFLRREYPALLAQELELWKRRKDTHSWYAERIREAMISSMDLRLTRSLLLIRTLVSLCPLLGLLGTVSGMIRVFDVMSVMGTANVRAIASGVSMATIPTMAGLVTALSGFYFSARLNHHAVVAKQAMADQIRDYESGVQ
jgi:biopolymer transport protein ExbB